MCDKHIGRNYPSAVRNGAAERDYYSVPAPVVEQIWAAAGAAGEAEGLPPLPQGALPTLSYEPSLGEIESAAAGVIDRVVRAQSLAGLSTDDRLRLSMFYTLQRWTPTGPQRRTGAIVSAITRPSNRNSPRTLLLSAAA